MNTAVVPMFKDGVFVLSHGMQFWLDEWLVAVRAVLRCARLVNHFVKYPFADPSSR
jgi:hypothetical protein